MLSSTILTLVLLPPRPRPLQTPASPQSPPATAAASSSHRPGWRRASSCRAKVSTQVWVASFLPRVGVWRLQEEYSLQPPDNYAEVWPMVEGLLAGKAAAGHGQLKRLVHAGREAGLHFTIVNNLTVFSYKI